MMYRKYTVNCRIAFSRFFYITGNLETLWNHEHESGKIMHVLHKLTPPKSEMAEGEKQGVHLWKETVLFYLIIVLQQGN